MDDEFKIYVEFALEIMRQTHVADTPTELHQWIADRLTRLGGKTNENAILTWSKSFDLVEEMLDKFALNAATPEEERKILDWPWPSWNHVIDPMEPGMLGVISAPDGSGKTLVCECIAEHWARRRTRVVFVHYELNKKIMMIRRTVRHSGISSREMRSGKLSAEQRRLIAQLRPQLMSWDGYITYIHTPGWDIDKTILALRERIAEQECDVIVLDYLEKVAPSMRQLRLFGSNVWQREADNVEQIKNFAEEVEIPVLMVTQMSKQGKQTKTADVDRMDMRGAGEKSEKANLVVLLTREKEGNGYSNMINVKVDKQTMGPLVVFKQLLQPEFFKMVDLTDREPPPHWSNS